MKLIVETDILKRALYLTGAEIRSRSPLPILGNLKFEAVESSLTITGTNLDIFIVETIEATIKEAGQITLPFSILAKLVDRVSASTLTISAGEKEAEVKAGEVTATFELIPVEEYPPTPNVKSEKVIECSAQEFVKPLRQVSFAMSDDPSLYSLMGVNLGIEKKTIDFAATNRTKLAQSSSGLNSIEETDIIIPDSTVRTILCNLGTINEPLRVTISSDEIQLEYGQSKIVSRLVEGRFPRYRGVIPENGSNVFSANRKELIEAVKTCSLFIQPPHVGIKLTGKKKEIEVSANGKAVAKVLGAELEGQPNFEIQFKWRDLLDTLAVLENETIRIECTDAKTAALIRENQFKAVLVPVYFNA